MVEPLKPSNVDRIRLLENRIQSLELRLKTADRMAAMNQRQVQPVQVYGGVASGATSAVKFSNNAGSAPLDTVRSRNAHDVYANSRGYTYRTHLLDNMGPGGTKANIIPPHHDMELLDILGGAINDPFPSTGANDTEPISYLRYTTPQTRLNNITATNDGLQATTPGAYLGEFSISIPIQKQVASGNNYKAGSVQITLVAGTVFTTLINGQFLAKWSRHASFAGSAEFDTIKIHGWFLWTPVALEQLKWQLTFTDALWVPNSWGYARHVGQVLLTELGRSNAMTGLTFTGAKSSTFEFSNADSETNYYYSESETAAAVISIIG